MEVTLLSASQTHVNARRTSDGREVSIKLAQLSEADRDFIRDWRNTDTHPIAPKHLEPQVIYDASGKQDEGVLAVTDWFNRGIGLSGIVVDQEMRKVYVSLHRTAAHDVAVFDYSEAGARHIATWKGFGQCLVAGLGRVITLRSGDAVCWDASDPGRPVAMHKEEGYSMAYTGVTATALAGNDLFTAVLHRLKMISFAPDSKKGFKIGKCSTSIQGERHDDIHVHGDLLYGVCHRLGKYKVAVYDISRRDSPEKIHEWDFESYSPEMKKVDGGAVLATMRGGKYLVISSVRFEQAAYVFDVTKPDNPIQLANYTPDDYSGGALLPLDETTLLMAMKAGEFQTSRMDESGMLRPLSGRLKTEGGWKFPATAIMRADPWVLATGWDANLIVMNVSDPADPSIHATLNPHPRPRDFHFDGQTFIAVEDASGVAHFSNIDTETGRLGRPFHSMKERVLALDADRLVFSRDGRLVLSEIRSGKLLEHLTIDEPALSAELAGNLLRIKRDDLKCVIYDVSDLRSPRKIDEIPMPWTDNLFPGVNDHDLALFSRYVAIRENDSLRIYECGKSGDGPVMTLPAGGPLGHAGKMLFYATDEGLNLVMETGDGLAHHQYPGNLFREDRKFSRSFKVNSDGRTLAVWRGSFAAVFELVSVPGAAPEIRKLGEAKIPTCECHGGWYGAVKGAHLITNDLFAAINIMKIRPERAGRRGAIIRASR